jgi:hypothetical protein
MRMASVAAGLAVLAATVAGAALAQAPGERLRDPAADAIDFTDKALEELALQLPTAPKRDGLIAFDPGRPTTMKFFVDPASVSVGTDGIVRYTLVALGDGAAANVSFEGIRCKTAERKTYAYGRADGSWYQPAATQWTKIGAPALEVPRFVLYQDFFCPSRQIVSTPVEAVEGLRLGAHPRASDLLTGTPIRR